ncbi:acetyl-coenzyme A synthetase [Psychrobacter sp. 1501(2011)]|nr:acetyl-coenzyme A synthetase [Psychrobacter sp. 1501(2011)]
MRYRFVLRIVLSYASQPFLKWFTRGIINANYLSYQRLNG